MAQIITLLGITGVLCYVAVVSLSNSSTWLGLVALLAAISALVSIATILASNMPKMDQYNRGIRKGRGGGTWWERLL